MALYFNANKIGFSQNPKISAKKSDKKSVSEVLTDENMEKMRQIAYDDIKEEHGNNNKTSMFFKNTLNDILLGKELVSKDYSLATCSNFDSPTSSQNCSINKEKITENEEAKDIFAICYECEDREECEHYQKMIEGNSDTEKNVIFLPSKTNKPFHKSETLLQKELYKPLGSSIIYNYNIVCSDIDIKNKRKKWFNINLHICG